MHKILRREVTLNILDVGLLYPQKDFTRADTDDP